MPVASDGFITGTDNADFITGGETPDTISGLGGNDSLVGEGGDDSLVGGAGNDTLRGGYGDDTLEGGDGDDEIEGLYGNDVIDTGAGNDHVFGRDGDDLIYGREGDDHLIGSIGTDTVYGGAGNDTMAGSQGNDEIHGGEGDDLAFIGTLEGSDRIFLDAGNDLLDGGFAGSSFYGEGGTGNDTMRAGVGDDTLLGGAGNDVLDGGAGNDMLTGGGDTDVVTGGDGDDVFIVLDAPGFLHITDFGSNGAADLMDLSQLDGYDTAEALSAVMTTQNGMSTFDLAVTDGTLVVTIASAEPLTATDFGLTGVLTGTLLEDTPDEEEDTTTDVGSDDPTDETAPLETFTLDGPDAGYFVVDGESGELSNIFWFSPSYNEVWDANGDHIYEVSLVEHDATGVEVSRSDLELVVGQSGVLWRDAGSDETPDDTATEPPDDTGTTETDTGDGVTYTLAGDDAGVFEVDSDTGDVSFRQWFTPSYDEVWDMNRDHIYEVAVIGQNAAGEELSREALELVVTETDAVWQEGSVVDEPDETPDEDDTGGEGSVDGSGGTAGLLYTLSGDDAAIFEVEAETGLVTMQSWFEPSFEDVWDMDRDHIYEISVSGTDADGEEISHVDLELVVSETDAVWQEAPPPSEGNPDGDTETPPETDESHDQSVDGSGGTEGLLYSLAGQDAAIFEVDSEAGLVTYQPWFTPSFEDVWDMDRDHIYEITVLGNDEAGEELSRVDLELVVSETDAVWQTAAPPEQTSGEELMNLLFTPMEDEDAVLPEEDIEESEEFIF